jgi:hypothetical protein
MARAYKPDKSICKSGWCHQFHWVSIAVGLVMDVSQHHSGWQRGKEVADKVPPGDIPNVRCRTVMYSRNIKRAISTDYVVVACCVNVGSFLVQLRREKANELSQHRYSMNWGQITSYDGKCVWNLCAKGKAPN